MILNKSIQFISVCMCRNLFRLTLKKIHLYINKRIYGEKIVNTKINKELKLTKKWLNCIFM